MSRTPEQTDSPRGTCTSRQDDNGPEDTMRNALDTAMRVYEDAVRQRDFATSEAERLGTISRDLRDRIACLEREAIDISAAAEALKRALDRESVVAEELRSRYSDTAGTLAALEAGLSEAVRAAEDAEAACLEYRTKIDALEEDAREMRKVSNLVALERKVADLQKENETLRRGRKARIKSPEKRPEPPAPEPAPEPPPPAPAPAPEPPAPAPEPPPIAPEQPPTAPEQAPEPPPIAPAPAPEQALPEEKLKIKTIKGKAYLASKTDVFEVAADGSRGARVGALRKDDKGRTKVEWAVVAA